jgi:hypothetical protein
MNSRIICTFSENDDLVCFWRFEISMRAASVSKSGWRVAEYAAVVECSYGAGAGGVSAGIGRRGRGRGGEMVGSAGRERRGARRRTRLRREAVKLLRRDTVEDAGDNLLGNLDRVDVLRVEIVAQLRDALRDLVKRHGLQAPVALRHHHAGRHCRAAERGRGGGDESGENSPTQSRAARRAPPPAPPITDARAEHDY